MLDFKKSNIKNTLKAAQAHLHHSIFALIAIIL